MLNGAEENPVAVIVCPTTTPTGTLLVNTMEVVDVAYAAVIVEIAKSVEFTVMVFVVVLAIVNAPLYKAGVKPVQ